MNSVLIVDNSRTMKGIADETFTELNIPCHFLEADSGKTALEELESNRVSLILLNWNMAGMNGIEFLKRVRAMPVHREMPIIMITSETPKYNMVEALQNGATDIMVKPFTKKDLIEKISGALF